MKQDNRLNRPLYKKIESELYAVLMYGIKPSKPQFPPELKTHLEGKCPKDNRLNRPIYITYKNEQTLAIADGKGHAYKVYGEGYDVYSSKCKPENRYDPSEYEFDRGLSGMDF